MGEHLAYDAVYRTGDFFVAQEGEEAAMCPADSEFAPMVYVFDEDGNAEIAVNSDGAEGTRDPVATGLVSQDMDNQDMPYVYEIGFLLAGDNAQQLLRRHRIVTLTNDKNSRQTLFFCSTP